MPDPHTHLMLETVASATALGLAAGFSPGPLLALTISQTLRYGVGEGIKVAFAPLFTDAPIIVASLVVLSLFARVVPVLGVVTLAGAVFVGWLGFDSFRASSLHGKESGAEARTLVKAICTNFLSPHPYIFWMTVGAPLVIRTWAGSKLAAALFPPLFLASLAAAKVVVALAAGRTKSMLTDRIYSIVMKVLGLALFACAILLAGHGAVLFASR